MVHRNMKLYVTYGSPYARLARIIVIEKSLEDHVEIIEAKTRTPGSPYYQINPSGRVPYLVDDTGVGMEDSQLICAYLDGLDGKPRFKIDHTHPIGIIFGSSSRRAACATAFLCGVGKWPGPRTSVRQPLLPMSQRALSAWRISSRTA
jgi:Glutathione S-transferase, N-terminal domain